MPFVIPTGPQPSAPATFRAGELTVTAQRMEGYLPDYYWGNPTVDRILQAWANEIDRIDAMLDVIKNGFVPSLADDRLGMLSRWEEQLNLPVAPLDATIAQRQQVVCATIQSLTAGTAQDVYAALTTIVGIGIKIYRETPGNLEDTIEIPYAPGAYSTGQLLAIARRMWPAHRKLNVAYTQGFLLDVSGLDRDEMF